MPFTLSHPAAVLPFARSLARRGILSAVIIGSMVPDVGWLLPWHLSRADTHTAKALLSFSLPVGLAVYWVFQWTVKTPLLELLPPGAYVRWRESSAAVRFGDWRQWVLTICGLLFGAITHLVWDAFTHEGARGVRMIPALGEPVMQIGEHRLAGPHLLQDVSSILGLVVVIAVLAYAMRPGRPADAEVPRRLSRHERRAWLLTYGLVALILSSLCYAIKRHGHVPIPGVSLYLSTWAISILRGTAGAVLMVSVALEMRLRARPADLA